MISAISLSRETKPTLRFEDLLPHTWQHSARRISDCESKRDGAIAFVTADRLVSSSTIIGARASKIIVR
jgi:hypothetical protein